MLWCKAFHIIAMVAWFAGLFYLPRLFVYHAQTLDDEVGYQRFMQMERRLYYGIMWPAAILTIAFGFGLLGYVPFYRAQLWMHWKLFFVFLLLAYHLYCGHCVKRFAHSDNKKSALFFRIFNEGPTLILFIIVCLVVIKPDSF